MGWVCFIASIALLSSTVESPMVDVRLADKGVEKTFSLREVPVAARKSFARFAAVAATQAPYVLRSGGEKTKGFVWSVAKNARGDALVFTTLNTGGEAVALTFGVEGKVPLTPTYRRVYSEDAGKTWKTMAFEPPHASVTGCPQKMPKPYAVEVPPHTCQTATVRLK